VNLRRLWLSEATDTREERGDTGDRRRRGERSSSMGGEDGCTLEEGGDLFCHYRALKYYSNVEYPPTDRMQKSFFCVRLVSFFQPTAHILGTAHKN
jgi:hypothetical protein